VNEILSWILDTVSSVDPVWRTVIAGVAMLLETSILLGLIVPGDTVLLVSATGVQGTAQYVALAIASVVGALAGESIGFMLGRYFGPRIRHSPLGRRIGERQWQRAERYLDRRGGIAVFLSRFLPVLHSLIPVTVGMSTMPYRRFIAWTLPACILWSFAYVTAGSVAAGSYRELADSLHVAGYLFVGAIVVFVIVVVIVKKLIARGEERHMNDVADAPDSAAGHGSLPR
jgi:membrane-associated protein